ncbi:hypothetical protein EOD39_16915 [Acipenser ruthenus]|uniref:Uncharacterized protein n=1 Tax=Acipenser ruthenus TaxID=7906 RepID=A0A444V4S1_ACIRT|nr:hypothetical protein EOD39_16915 [Acipenser ruthenus]
MTTLRNTAKLTRPNQQSGSILHVVLITSAWLKVYTPALTLWDSSLRVLHRSSHGIVERFVMERFIVERFVMERFIVECFARVNRFEGEGGLCGEKLLVGEIWDGSFHKMCSTQLPLE